MGALFCTFGCEMMPFAPVENIRLTIHSVTMAHIKEFFHHRCPVDEMAGIVL